MDNLTRDKIPFLYQEIFEKHPAGVVILDELWTRYFDTTPKFPLDPLHLAFQAGQRDVIRFIQLRRDQPARDAANKEADDADNP